MPYKKCGLFLSWDDREVISFKEAERMVGGKFLKYEKRSQIAETMEKEGLYYISTKNHYIKQQTFLYVSDLLSYLGIEKYTPIKHDDLCPICSSFLPSFWFLSGSVETIRSHAPKRGIRNFAAKKYQEIKKIPRKGWYLPFYGY